MSKEEGKKEKLQNIPEEVWDMLPEECREQEYVVFAGLKYRVGSTVFIRVKGAKLTHVGNILCVASSTGHIYVWTGRSILVAHASRILYMEIYYIPEEVWDMISEDCKEQEYVVFAGLKYRVGSTVFIRVKGAKLTHVGKILCVVPSTGHVIIMTARSILVAHASQISYMEIYYGEKGEIE